MMLTLKPERTLPSPHGGPDLAEAYAVVDEIECHYRARYLHFVLSIYASQQAGYPALSSASVVVSGVDFDQYFAPTIQTSILEQIRIYLIDVRSRGITADIDLGNFVLSDWQLEKECSK